MKKRLLIFIPVFIIICVFFLTRLLNEKDGVEIYIENKTGITIDSISLYLSNSTEKIVIYTTNNITNTNVIEDLIDITNYPKSDYSLGVSFDIGEINTENIIQYLPSSTNGDYQLYIKIENGDNNTLNAHITYKDNFTVHTEDIALNLTP